MCECIFTGSDPEPLMLFKFFTSAASQVHQVLDYASCLSALLGVIEANFAFLQKSRKVGSCPPWLMPSELMWVQLCLATQIHWVFYIGRSQSLKPHPSRLFTGTGAVLCISLEVKTVNNMGFFLIGPELVVANCFNP